MTKKLIEVDAQAFDDLMYWLDRCADKGHLENCHDLVEPWAKFDESSWREVPATQPATGSPVAHKLVAVQVNGEWKEIKGKWVDGSPIAEMIEGVEEGYLRVELAFGARPAAAHEVTNTDER